MLTEDKEKYRIGEANGTVRDLPLEPLEPARFPWKLLGVLFLLGLEMARDDFSAQFTDPDNAADAARSALEQARALAAAHAALAKKR